MILADTSAWIEFDRASGSRVDTRLTELIGTEAPVAVSEPIVMEVLAGARSDRAEADLRRMLARFALLRTEPLTDFEAAARIYRSCRREGVTPRGLLDCLIAAVAWRCSASLLTADRDLVRIAGVIGIAVDEGSPSV